VACFARAIIAIAREIAVWPALVIDLRHAEPIEFPCSYVMHPHAERPVITAFNPLLCAINHKGLRRPYQRKSKNLCFNSSYRLDISAV
jgi:hypothetical protein